MVEYAVRKCGIEEQHMEHSKRHRIVWKLLRPFARLLLKCKFNYSAPTYAPEGPFIVLCNHVTDWDPIFVGAAFKEQMYFVTSEHLLRLGFVSKLIMWLQAPIARQKGGSAAGAVKAMLRAMKEGHNIGLFPEGNRTWDGVTRDFPASTGKLVRTCGGTLVTFRLSGGYFASPRWAGAAIRKGRVRGQVVGTYSPEELKAMSPEEINAIIRRDLYEDAYEEQRKHPVPYRGKRLAEHLETLLFTCPKCGAMHRMVSRDDRFICENCGMETRFSVNGFFSGGRLPFDNVRDWNRWQEEQIKKLCERAGDGPIFSDSELQLSRVDSARGSEIIGFGELLLYKDHLELPTGISLPVEEITGMSLRGPSDLYIGTANGSSFELHSGKVRCTVKYLSACTALGSPVGCGV